MNTSTIPTLRYYKLDEDAVSPKFATQNSACFDLCAHLIPGTILKLYTPFNKEINTRISAEGSVYIEPGDRALVPTGLIFDIPDGYSVRLHIRSGCAYKEGLALANAEAVIDDDYRNETFILLTNTSMSSVNIINGERLAQGELVKTLGYDMDQTSEQPTQKTDRNGGVGSTGKI